MIYDDIHGHLTALQSVTDLVGQRVYYIHLPQEPTLPAIAIRQVGSEHEHHFEGAAGLVETTIRFSVFSTDLEEVISITEALRQVLHGYSGPMGSLSVGFCYLEEIEDDAFKPDDASDAWVYLRASDFTFRHQETVPTF